MATIPAKANIGKQAEFLISLLYPCLREARNGLRTVLFLDAAHFVHGSFLGCLWSKDRVLVKTPSGRRRLNVLGVVNAITKRLHVLSNETYINSQVLCDFLREIVQVYVGQPITIVLDMLAIRDASWYKHVPKALEYNCCFYHRILPI